MPTATFNQNFIIPGASELYLAPYPGAWAGANLAALEATVWSTFYSDGTKRRTLNATYLNKQWAVLDDSGVAVKVKQNETTFNSVYRKIPIGIASTEMDIECVCADIDAAHLTDIFSITSGEITTIAAAAGQAGRTTIALGCQPKFNYYTLMIRYLSGNNIISAGSVREWDHYIFPKVALMADMDFKFSPKEAIKAKVKLQALPDLLLTSPDSGRPISAFSDTATTPGT